MNDLLSLRDIGADAVYEILRLSEDTDLGTPLAGEGVALLFQKPSARTRNSIEMAVVQLGGHPLAMRGEEIGLGTRESPQDVARTLACYHAVIAARVSDHILLQDMAGATATPVLNMLSNSDHPLQGLADLLTIRQLAGSLEGVRVAYVGDANNVARSLAEGCGMTGVALTLACPEGYCFDPAEFAQWPSITQVHEPVAAVDGAAIVYTDVWVSMGQDDDDARRRAFARYQVDESLMAASADAWFMHCLPARRGEEVAAAVIDGPRSAVWRQAENRLHTARGALAWMVGR